MLGTPDAPEERRFPGSVARQRRQERLEEPGPAQGRADTQAAPPRTPVLRPSGWGGAGTAKVAMAGRVKPSGARPATHLSRVDRCADSASALPRRSCGPRRVAGTKPPRPPRTAGVWWQRTLAGAGRVPGAAHPRTRLCSLLALSLAAGPGPAPARGALRPPESGPGTRVPRQREPVELRELGPSAARPAPWSRRLCGAERSWAERSAHCSLAFGKATLAAGRRDAGLTHARARVNARFWGCEGGSDGRRRRSGWAGRGRGAAQGALGLIFSPFQAHLFRPLFMNLVPSKVVVPPAPVTCASVPLFPLSSLGMPFPLHCPSVLPSCKTIPCAVQLLDTSLIYWAPPVGMGGRGLIRPQR